MSVILQALEKQDKSVEKLEGSVESLSNGTAEFQPDMFGAASNQNTVEIAEKLDNAIEKVEFLLQEGA